MADGKKLTGAGLRGQVAGETALCTVGKTGTGLTYRGYDITDLAENTCFEEVAHLILKGELPTQSELDAYRVKLRASGAFRRPSRRCSSASPPAPLHGCHAHGLLHAGYLETEQDLAAGRCSGSAPRCVPFDHQLLVSLLP